jgi:hypothetical protein
MEKEVASYEAQHQELVVQYLGEHIAMYQGKVIDHDRAMFSLLDRVNANYLHHVILVQQVQPTLPPPLVFRSPRLQA